MLPVVETIYLHFMELQDPGMLPEDMLSEGVYVRVRGKLYQVWEWVDGQNECVVIDCEDGCPVNLNWYHVPPEVCEMWGLPK